MRSKSETAQARAILETIFADSHQNFNVHLWNGSILRFGTEAPEFRLVLMDKAAFKRICWEPDALLAGKAFVRKEIDVQGDQEKALELLTSMACRPLPFLRRLGLKWKVARL